MLAASEIRAIMHKIQASGMKLDLPLVTFVKSLYPTHSNYLESLPANDKFKYLTFDNLVEKIADREKAFGKKSSKPAGESPCFAQKAKNQPKDPSKGDSSKRGRGRRNFRGRGGRSKRSDLQCKRCGNTGHTSDQCWASWDSIKDKNNQKKDDQDASKSSDSCIVAHCNLGTNEMTYFHLIKIVGCLILVQHHT